MSQYQVPTSVNVNDEKQEATIENQKESEKVAKQLTLNAKRCRAYRQRKKINKNVSLANTSVNADYTGSFLETVRSRNALYCQRYRNKKKIQRSEKTSLITGSSLLINEKQEATAEKNKEESEKIAEQLTLNAKHCTYRQYKKVNNNVSLANTSGIHTGSSFETVPSRNALYCQRYRNKKKIQQRENNLLITGSSLLISEKQEAMVEKNKEVSTENIKMEENLYNYQLEHIKGEENNLYVETDPSGKHEIEIVEENLYNYQLEHIKEEENLSIQPVLSSKYENLYSNQLGHIVEEENLCIQPFLPSKHKIETVEENLYDYQLEHIKEEEDVCVQPDLLSKHDIEILKENVYNYQLGHIAEEENLGIQPVPSSKHENLYNNQLELVKEEENLCVQPVQPQ